MSFGLGLVGTRRLSVEMNSGCVTLFSSIEVTLVIDMAGDVREGSDEEHST